MLRPYKRRHRVVREDQLGNEEGVAQVRQRVVEALCRMDGPQRTEILFGVLANLHRSLGQPSQRNRRARYIVPLRVLYKAACQAVRTVHYRIDWRAMREPGRMPKPLPPRGTPLGKTPLPLEGKGAGPAAPPPATAIGGAPNETGADGRGPLSRQ